MFRFVKDGLKCEVNAEKREEQLIGIRGFKKSKSETIFLSRFKWQNAKEFLICKKKWRFKQDWIIKSFNFVLILLSLHSTELKTFSGIIWKIKFNKFIRLKISFFILFCSIRIFFLKSKQQCDIIIERDLSCFSFKM